MRLLSPVCNALPERRTWGARLKCAPLTQHALALVHAGRDVGHDGFSGFWRQMDGFVSTMNAVDYIFKNHGYSWKYYLENFAQFAIGICRASLGQN